MSEYDDTYRVMVESNNMGILFCRQGSYQMAAMFHLQALKIAESIGGKLSKDYCDSLYNLGNTCADAGDYETALKYLSAARQSAGLRGEDGMDMVHLLNSIAYVMENKGDYAAAVEYLENALEKLRALQKTDKGEPSQEHKKLSEGLARDIFYLAGVCEKAGDMKKALRYYNELLQLLRGLDAPYYPSCLSGAANALSALGNVQGAMELRQEAAEQVGAQVGLRSISYAQCLRNLAVMYRGQGDYARAKALMRDSISIKREILGMNSKETIREILFYIELHAVSDETDRALDIFMELLNDIGVDFDGYEDILQELATLYMSMGDINRLNELYNKAAQMYQTEDEEPL